MIKSVRDEQLGHRVAEMIVQHLITFSVLLSRPNVAAMQLSQPSRS
jgi:hypothetical protein